MKEPKVAVLEFKTGSVLILTEAEYRDNRNGYIFLPGTTHILNNYVNETERNSE